jgi:hypothetical protein
MRLARKTEESVKAGEMEPHESKTLLPGEPMKQPSWPVWSLMKGFRVLALTVLWAALGMGVGLFGGIVGVVAWSAMTHRAAEMDLAYRNIALPLAICTGTCAFIWNLLRVVQAGVRKRRGE